MPRRNPPSLARAPKLDDLRARRPAPADELVGVPGRFQAGSSRMTGQKRTSLGSRSWNALTGSVVGRRDSCCCDASAAPSCTAMSSRASSSPHCSSRRAWHTPNSRACRPSLGSTRRSCPLSCTSCWARRGSSSWDPTRRSLRLSPRRSSRWRRPGTRRRGSPSLACSPSSSGRSCSRAGWRASAS